MQLTFVSLTVVGEQHPAPVGALTSLLAVPIDNRAPSCVVRVQ